MKNKISKVFGYLLSTVAVSWTVQYIYDKYRIAQTYDGLLGLPNKLFELNKDNAVKIAVGSANFPYLFALFAVASLVWGSFLFVKIADYFYTLITKRLSETKTSKLLINVCLYILTFIALTFFAFPPLAYIEIVPNVLNRIEILRPSISEEEYIMLRAKYYNVGSNEEMLTLRESIDHIAKDHDVKFNN